MTRGIVTRLTWFVGYGRARGNELVSMSVDIPGSGQATLLLPLEEVKARDIHVGDGVEFSFRPLDLEDTKMLHTEMRTDRKRWPQLWEDDEQVGL